MIKSDRQKSKKDSEYYLRFTLYLREKETEGQRRTWHSTIQCKMINNIIMVSSRLCGYMICINQASLNCTLSIDSTRESILQRIRKRAPEKELREFTAEIMLQTGLTE